MIRIDYPAHDFRLSKDGSTDIIFDEWRKRWVKLTPEEWVRQQFLQFLVKVQGYPASLVAVEREIMVGELRKRFDILVFNKAHQPWMMIECKSESVPLTEAVFSQVLRYSIAVPAKYLLITNGRYCAGWVKNDNRLQVIDHFPLWES